MASSSLSSVSISYSYSRYDFVVIYESFTRVSSNTAFLSSKSYRSVTCLFVTGHSLFVGSIVRTIISVYIIGSPGSALSYDSNSRVY